MKFHLACCSVCFLLLRGARGFPEHGSVTGEATATSRNLTLSASFQGYGNEQQNEPAATSLQSSPRPTTQAASSNEPQTRVGVFNVLQRILDTRDTSVTVQVQLTLPADNATGIHARPEDIAALSQMPNATTDPGPAPRQDTIPDAIRAAPFGELVYTTPQAQAAGAPSAGPGPVSSDPSPAPYSGAGTADVLSTEEFWSAAAEAPSLAVPQGVPQEDTQGARYPGGLVPGQTPPWAGQPIQHIRRQSRPKLAGAMPTETITSFDDLADLSDDQLYQIFQGGTPDIPANLPGSAGSFTFCTGKPLVNAFTDAGWPAGSWSAHQMSPLNNAVQRVWRGKVFYQSPATNQTMLWNLFWSNSTVAVIGNITVMEPGISADGRASAVIDYGGTESLFFRALRDEIRRVGPSMWLGRAWFADPVDNWHPKYEPPLQRRLRPKKLQNIPAFPITITTPYVGTSALGADPALVMLNDTVLHLVETSGFEGQNSTPQSSGESYPNLGTPLAILYFAMDCAQDAVPKLYYTDTAQAQAALSTQTGHNRPDYELPRLNGVAEPNAVEQWENESPVSTAGRDTEPFILYPWKFSDVGPYGYLKMPARLFEPVFGAWWLYDYRKRAESQIRDPITAKAQDAIEFPIRETAQKVAAPILDPIAREFGEMQNNLVSPFVIPAALDLPVRAP